MWLLWRASDEPLAPDFDNSFNLAGLHTLKLTGGSVGMIWIVV